MKAHVHNITVWFLTCCGQHGAGKEQGGYEVPVAVGAVTQHGHSIVVGLQCSGQQLLQTRLGHTGVVAQKFLPSRLHLLSKLTLVRQLDDGEEPSADYEVKDVSAN